MTPLQPSRLRFITTLIDPETDRAFNRVMPRYVAGGKEGKVLYMEILRWDPDKRDAVLGRVRK